MGMVTFSTQGNADFIYNQSKSVAVNSSVADIGQPGERTSYMGVYEQQPDGSLVPLRLWYLDTFGIVREGDLDVSDTPAWIQPTGAQDAYPALNVAGAQTQVTHNGSVWANSHGNGNIWEPGVFGWVSA